MLNFLLYGLHYGHRDPECRQTIYLDLDSIYVLINGLNNQILNST